MSKNKGREKIVVLSKPTRKLVLVSIVLFIGFMVIFFGTAFVPPLSASAIMTDDLKKGDGISLIVQGTGDISCQNQTKSHAAELFILLSEASMHGKLHGSGMGVRTQDNLYMGVGLNGGFINSTSFEVRGTVFVDTICNEELITITAKGICGDTMPVLINSSSVYGVFPSKVDCISS